MKLSATKKEISEESAVSIHRVGSGSSHGYLQRETVHAPSISTPVSYCFALQTNPSQAFQRRLVLAEKSNVVWGMCVYVF